MENITQKTNNGKIFIDDAAIRAEAEILLKPSDETSGSSLKPLRAIRFSDVEAKPVNWLWEPFLALGTFNLIEGEEGVGKTFLVCALGCAIGHGRGLPLTPEHKHIESSNVLLISAEDSLPHVLKPRLESMGAPCERIFAVEEPFTFDRDGIVRFSMVLAEHSPKLVVIDPLFSYTGKINLDRDSDIRSITDELKRLAEKYDCCILGIRHIGKSKGFGDARNAGLNGVGWRASARSALLIGKNPENESQKALCQTKNNLAPKFANSLGFEIRDGQFFWTGESHLTAETMLSSMRGETSEEKTGKNEAVEFLRATLKDGEKESEATIREAKRLNITDYSFRQAKQILGVKSVKHGGHFGGKQGWFLSLPEDVEGGLEDAEIKTGQHLQVNDSDKTSYDNKLTEDVESETPRQLQSTSSTSSTTCPNCSSELSISADKSVFCPMGCRQ